MAYPYEGAQKGAFHFSANKEMFEIQRGNNFEFIIYDIDNLKYWGDDTQTFTDAQNKLRLSVLSSSVPHFSQNAIEVKRGNTTVKYAGTISYDSGSLRIYDFIGVRGKDILMAWQAQAGDPLTQKVGLQKDYKRECRLVEYSPDYEETVRVWRLEGCWISGISEDDYSQDANGSRAVSATIQYDRAVVEWD